nr:uncharacterized protein LOC123768449 [Procambarus clarkii]
MTANLLVWLVLNLLLLLVLLPWFSEVGQSTCSVQEEKGVASGSRRHWAASCTTTSDSTAQLNRPGIEGQLARPTSLNLLLGLKDGFLKSAGSLDQPGSARRSKRFQSVGEISETPQARMQQVSGSDKSLPSSIATSPSDDHSLDTSPGNGFATDAPESVFANVLARTAANGWTGNTWLDYEGVVRSVYNGSKQASLQKLGAPTGQESTFFHITAAGTASTLLSVPATMSTTESQKSSLVRKSVLLCDHPPQTYSSNFQGQAEVVCGRHKKFHIQFSHTILMCKNIYQSFRGIKAEPHYVIIYDSQYEYYLAVYDDETFVQICLPLFRTFDICEEMNFLTVCREARVGFLHSHHCLKPSEGADISGEFLASFILLNDTQCFQEFCKGTLTVIDSEVKGVHYRLFNTLTSSTASLCSYQAESLHFFGNRHNKTLYLIVNNHWPCCYDMYIVAWVGDPLVHRLNAAWSYLPASCQIGEVLLITWVAIIGASGLVGNLVVVVVMWSGGHHRQESSMMRTSLALANLICTLLVVFPSLCNHLVPFFYPTEFIEVLHPDEILDFHHREDVVPSTENPIRRIDNYADYTSGFFLFQSLMYCVSSTVSVLTIFLLSLERFVLTGRPLLYRDYFTMPWVQTAIALTWITGLSSAFMFAAHYDTNLGASVITFTKLPLGTSDNYPNSFIYAILFYCQYSILVIAGVSIIIFSVLAIHNFVKTQKELTAEWEKMAVAGPYKEENRRILITLILTLMLFLASCVPIAIEIIFRNIHFKFKRDTLFTYFAQWMFVSRSAWNPWVYNFRSREFKEEVSKLLEVLPEWMRLQPSGARSRRLRDLHDLDSQTKLSRILERLGPKDE